jgi:hypothetical protein
MHRRLICRIDVAGLKATLWWDKYIKRLIIYTPDEKTRKKLDEQLSEEWFPRGEWSGYSYWFEHKSPMTGLTELVKLGLVSEPNKARARLISALLEFWR